MIPEWTLILWMLGCYSSTAVRQQKRRDFRTLRSPFTSDCRRAPALDVDTPMLERCKEFGWSTLNRSLPSHLPTSLICHFPLPAALLYLFPCHMYPLPYSILPSPLPVPKYEETVLHNSLDSSNALPKASRHLAKSLTKLLWLHHRQMMSADYFVRKRPPYKEPARKDTLAYWLIICIICIICICIILYYYVLYYIILLFILFFYFFLYVLYVYVLYVYVLYY